MIQLEHLVRYSKFLHDLPNMDQFDAYSINDDENSLLSLLSDVYEWEYKYNKVLGMDIPERRKDLMLEKIEDKVNPIILSIAGLLKETYQNWLEFHNFSSPEDQAQKFVDDASNEGSEFVLGSMWNEYNRYCYTTEQQKTQDAISALSQISDVSYIVDGYVDDELACLEQDKESFSEEEYENQVSYIESLRGDMPEAIGNYVSNYGGITEFIEMLVNNGVDAESIAYAMYRDVILPEWYNYWTNSDNNVNGRSIDDVYNDNVTLLNELNSIGSQSFKQKLATISLALNGVHVNGDMLDHLKDKYNEFAGTTDKESLDTLSNVDDETIERWNNELLEGL